MTEQRITEYETPEGNTHTSTTIITDDSRGRGSGWTLVVVLLIALAVGIWAFAQFNSGEVAKDAAVADAAESVGAAANQIGDSVQNVADEVTKN